MGLSMARQSPGRASVWCSVMLLPLLRLLLVLSVVEIVSADHASVENLVVRVDPEIGAEDCTLFQTQLENLVTTTSQQLHGATRGRLQWRRVTVLVPTDWRHCFGGRTAVGWKAADRRTVDVVVGRSHPLLADLPWARQFAGCGVQGAHVQLSHRFIQSISAANAFHNGRQVLREWIKYRYGVFDEIGFRADDQYPTSFLQDGLHLIDNDCATHSNTSEIVYERDDMSNTTVAVNVTSTHRSTSILASLDASDFCDAWSHNGALPTKQNVLCDERSVWQVMESHADFQPNRRRRRQSEEENEAVSAEPETSADQDTVDTGADDETPTPPTSPTFAAPVFEYVLPSRPRYVLVLDRSTATAERTQPLITCQLIST